MKLLQKGANAPLTRATSGPGRTRVELRWDPARGALNALCFAVDAAGQVPGDEWLVFVRNPQAPGGVIHLLSSAEGRAAYSVMLDELPATIQRCVFAATLEQGAFRELRGATLGVKADSGDPLAFRLEEAADEQALIFAELYRHSSAWKLRAIGQGFTGGFQPLVEHFGVTLKPIDAGQNRTPRPPPTAPPAVAPSSPEQVGGNPDPRQSSSGRSTAEPAARQGGARGSDHGGRQGARRGGGGLMRRLKRLLGWLLTIAILIAAVGAGVWFFKPGWIEAPETIWPEVRAYIERQASALPPASCDLTDEQVFERYHALGENYVRILNRVDQSNRLLAELRQQIGQLQGSCPAAINTKSRREIAELEQLPVATWMQEATRLNACAGLIIKGLETELSDETRPIILQRLVRESDRARNLESDLTNIARDLAYLGNKTDRLIAGFSEVLDACPE
jgi:tellurite resistance protein TerA